MTGRASPFAALTGAEKQIKWLEVQSVKLPYVSGSVDPLPDVEDETISDHKPQAEYRSKPPEVQNQQKPAQIKPSQSSAAARIDFQKTRHRQYDAVIARMRQAELAAKQYHPLG